MESIEDSMVRLDRSIVRRMYRLSRKDNMVKLDRTSLEHVYKLSFKQNIIRLSVGQYSGDLNFFLK